MGDTSSRLDAAAGRKILERLAAHLARSGITEEEIGRVSRLSAWQSLIKNNDGEAEIHDLTGFQLAPAWADGPGWPVMRPGPAVKVPASRPRRNSTDDGTVVAVLPDMQIGYYRHPNGELEPTHDPEAIDVALALLREIRPDRVVLVGDNLDLPELGKYRLSPAFQQTTQAAIDYATTLLARLRATTCGPIDWLAGNHEERLQHWLMDNARAAFGLRQGASPDGWPVLSVPHLCRLTEHGVTYHPGYPASDVWLTDNLKVIHGDRVKSRGSTAHKYLDEQKVSVIYGHVHRIEVAHRTREDIDGPAEIMAASPGCLARIDGAVPSTRQGLDLDGRPLHRAEDWQQGLGVVTIHADGWQYEHARISGGRAWWRGKTWEAA
jgi:predicted phosphodiesterase